MILDQLETGVVVVGEKPLTRDESSRLALLEKAIQDNFLGWMIVGLSLDEINKKRLYRTREGRTFDKYCLHTLSINARRAYQLINAALVVENVKNFTQTETQGTDFITPKNEAQAKELAILPPEEQGPAWVNIVAQAGQAKDKLTAGKIKKAVSKIRGEKLTKAIKQTTEPDNTTEEKKLHISKAFEAAWTALWEQVEKEKRANWRYTSKAVVYERTMILLEAFRETGVQSPLSTQGAK